MVCATETLVKTILQEGHDSPYGDHLDMAMTLEKIQSRFYWPGQHKDVENWCKSCKMCDFQKSYLQGDEHCYRVTLLGALYNEWQWTYWGPCQ